MEVEKNPIIRIDLNPGDYTEENAQKLGDCAARFMEQ